VNSCVQVFMADVSPQPYLLSAHSPQMIYRSSATSRKEMKVIVISVLLA